MNKLKMIFNQSLFVSTGILFCVGISQLIGHFTHGWEYIKWEWYIPLSFVLAGFCCSLPTLLLVNMTDSKSKIVRIGCLVLHFILEGGIVTFFGFIFGWCKSFEAYIPIIVMYVLIYIFVWCGMYLMYRKEDEQINEAIKEIRDEE